MESDAMASGDENEATPPAITVISTEDATSVEPTIATNGNLLTTKLQVALLETISDIQIQSQVQECMDSMLLDVETTFYLRHELELRATQQELETARKHHQATIFEADAERQARQITQLALADQMVQEVMALSRELEELVQWKRDHAHKVDEYERLVAKLAQTEDELQSAQERVSRLPVKVIEEVVSSKEEPATEKVEPLIEQPIGAAEEPTTMEEEVDMPIEDTPSHEESTMTGSPSYEEAEEDTKPAAVVEGAVEPAATVALDDEEPESDVPGLVEVDVEILMTIFGFLDAMDILNMAQINIAMYTKIDNIFGISEDGQSPPQPTSARTPGAAAAAATAPTTSKPVISSTVTTATVAQLPTTLTPIASGPIGNRLFSMLQPARMGPGAKKQPQGLHPTVAQSMASKLSDAEIGAILSMTDKLNKMDKEVSVLRSEKEAMSAKLDGTEAVKQFLINKVRDIELKLVQSRDDEVKVTQQIASDQEVIAFLDSRVQELERQTETLTKDKSRTQSELDTIKVQTSKKITMLNDMLKYEREKLKDDEGEWKATKRVLIKEVKNCRAQILALQAERDGLKEQNEMLKRAIVSTGKSQVRATSPMR